MRRLLLALLLLAPSAASAQDFGARVTPAGIDQLTTVAAQHVPEELTVPAIDRELYDCPGERVISAHVPDVGVQLGWHSMGVRAEDGSLVVDAVIDIDVATPLTIDNPYACFGEAMCDLTAAVRELAVEVELAASTGPEGGVELHGATVALDLTADDLDIDSEECLIGDVATWLFEAVEGWALDLMMPRLETMLGERISATMTELMGDTLGLTIERAGFSIEGWLDGLELSRSQGLTLQGDADVSWAGPTRWNHEDAPDMPGPEGDALPESMSGQFQVAASDRLVNEALFEAWQGGMISRLLADQSLSVELPTEGVVQQMGLPQDTTIDIALDIEAPLVASFGREGDDVASVSLRELHVMVDVNVPNETTRRIDIYVDGDVAAELTVDPEVGGLVLNLHDLDISQLRAETGEHELSMDPARLRTFVCETVTPMLSERLSGLPVAPALHPIAGMFFHVTALESERGWQRVGVDLHLPDPSDTDAPDTSLVDPPTLLPAGTASFTVEGRDDSTPTSLLRYRAWLDGEPLHESPSGLREVRFDAVDGEHVLEVAAVDLNDNEDPVPVIHAFVVDGTAPTLALIEQPGAVVTDPFVVVAWEASDEQSATLESRWILRAVHRDGTTEVVRESPWGADEGVVEIATGMLDNHDLYEIEVVVRDAAGNVTSNAAGFALHPSLVSSGCSASAGGGSAPVGLVILFALGLLVRRRRVA